MALFTFVLFYLLSQSNGISLTDYKSPNFYTSSQMLKFQNERKSLFDYIKKVENSISEIESEIKRVEKSMQSGINSDGLTVDNEDEPANYFGLDHIYVINLDGRRDRLETMNKIFKKLNAKFTRVAGIDKHSDELKKKMKELNADSQKLDETGLAIKLSHLKALKHAEKHGYERFLVLEDDVDLDLMVGELLPLMLAKLPEDWGIYYLTYTKNASPYPKHNSLIYTLDKYVTGNLALVYNSSVLKKIQKFAIIDKTNTYDYMLGEMMSKKSEEYGIVGYASDFILAQHMGSTPENPSDNLDLNELLWSDKYVAEELLSSTYLSLSTQE
ncbi:hypothetical protein HK099_006528 [Clydaea vesicula]|uniref:Glycosyl transferase family 25 domain-containing protein n=1 Tax=Clydaea vesicula TaxID=447962 RepID=A0AAD5Y0V3_9FUNG|nr:hypothetical protein HK099_006528 [Clydaea vesicula]KAJ3385614.1 hypothetical protein HDU92_002970 [Lobulomyces angularis]